MKTSTRPDNPFAYEFVGSIGKILPEISASAGLSQVLSDAIYDRIREPLVKSALSGVVGISVTNKVPVSRFLEAMRNPATTHIKLCDRIAHTLGLSSLSDAVVLNDLQLAQQAASQMAFYDTVEAFARVEAMANDAIPLYEHSPVKLMGRVLKQKAATMAPRIGDGGDSDVANIQRGVALINALDNVLMRDGHSHKHTRLEEDLRRNEIEVSLHSIRKNLHNGEVAQYVNLKAHVPQPTDDRPGWLRFATVARGTYTPAITTYRP